MDTNNILVDLVIPVYRPDEKFDRLMEKLQSQTRQIDHIFILHTLGPGEESDIEKKYSGFQQVRVIPIAKADFDHGGTRNYGASLSTAQFIMFMTQDAVPADKYLVERLVDAIYREDIAVAYGRQLAGPEGGIIEEYTRVFNYPNQDQIKSLQDFPKLGIKTYFCSNVCALYRREIYIKLGGFVTKTIFNEDMIMAAKMIHEGYSIAYASQAKVVHSHKYTYWQQFTRNFDLAVSQRQYSEIFENIKSEREGVRLVKQTANYLVNKGKWYLLPDLFFQSGFKYLGYKMGLNYQKLPHFLVRKCSMNPGYWN